MDINRDRLIKLIMAQKHLHKIIKSVIKHYENHCNYLKYLDKLIDRRFCDGTIDMDFICKAADMVKVDDKDTAEVLNVFIACCKRNGMTEAAR